VTVELSPITDADVTAVADFLSAGYDDQIPWARSKLAGPWKVDAPNHGFMLRDGQRIVGVHLAFYSERLIAGTMERFCDLGTWFVLPEFRFHSLRLIKAVLAQDGYHFKALTPMKKVPAIHARLGFRYLDTSAVLIPNLPWPSIPGRTTVSADPAVIERTLTGAELELYHDHSEAMATHHLVLIRSQHSCYVMYRVTRPQGIPLAIIHFVSNPELFRRAIFPLTRHLLFRHRVLMTYAERRNARCRPALSVKVTPRPKRYQAPWPKLYRSASLEPDQIDDLYSEFLCLPW
jgi:hypothetical protein